LIWSAPEIVAKLSEQNLRSTPTISSAKQLSDSTTSLQAEIDGFLKSIAAAAKVSRSDSEPSRAVRAAPSPAGP
jgi:hypothetical protein